jgi:hypothetical protein
MELLGMLSALVLESWIYPSKYGQLQGVPLLRENELWDFLQAYENPVSFCQSLRVMIF